MSGEPKEFSREVENLIADLRGLPGENSGLRRRPTTDLAKLIDALLIKYRINDDSVEHRIRAKWAEIVGTANAAYSHAVVVERGQLLVLVSHAVVRQELFHHRLDILAKLRGIPGCENLKGIHLRAG